MDCVVYVRAVQGDEPNAVHETGISAANGFRVN